jgi:uncharacterized protein (DUF1330 family)
LLLSLAVVVLSTVVASGSAQAQDAAQPLVFVDFVVMSEGHGLDERDIYDAKATPIAARHGVKRFASFDIVQHLLTPGLKPQRLDLWLLPSLEALKAWGDDPEYHALLAYRDKVHDMRALTLYFAKPAGPVEAIGQGNYLIELQTIGSGFDRAVFDEYERDSDEIAASYAIRRVGVYTIVKKVTGAGPDGQRLNIWYLPNEQNFQAWGENKAFQALAPEREKLFDLPNYLMLLGRAH